MGRLITASVLGSPGHDKLHKVRPILPQLNDSICKACKPLTLSIDESMEAFKERTSLKQYMPLKPMERGYSASAGNHMQIGCPAIDDVGNAAKSDKKRGPTTCMQYVMSPCALQHAPHPFIRIIAIKFNFMTVNGSLGSILPTSKIKM